MARAARRSSCRSPPSTAGSARETCHDPPPCRGAGNLRSRSVGRMRQIRRPIPDLPRLSALSVGSPADAPDAPLQGWPIVAGLPRLPPRGRLSDPFPPGSKLATRRRVGSSQRSRRWTRRGRLERSVAEGGRGRRPLERRASNVSRGTDPERRNPRLVRANPADLPHSTDLPRGEVPRAVDRADDRGRPPARSRCLCLSASPPAWLNPSRGAARAPRARRAPAGLGEPDARRPTRRSPPSGVGGR